MSVVPETAKRLNALKQSIETKTGETHADLTEGVQALVDKYGSEDLDTVLTEQEALIAELLDALTGKGSAWYNAFWDSYLKDFETAGRGLGLFAGGGWNADTFKPNRRIVIASNYEGAAYMFFGFNRQTGNTGNNKDSLIDFSQFNDLFDFSNATDLRYTFQNARIINLFVDCSSATSLTNTFASGNGGYLEYLTIKVTSNTTSFGGIFSYQQFTKEIRFTDDSEIAGSISFQHSTALSKGSMDNIIPKLSDAASGKTATFSKYAVNSKYETTSGAHDGSTSEEWLTLIGTKPNWTFTLV